MNRKERARRQKIFAEQCTGIAFVFSRFDADKIAADAKKQRCRKIHADRERQIETHEASKKAVLDGLEKYASTIGRKTAFKGFRQIVEAGTK